MSLRSGGVVVCECRDDDSVSYWNRSMTNFVFILSERLICLQESTDLGEYVR